MDFAQFKSLLIFAIISRHTFINGGIIQRYDEDLHEDDECGFDASIYSGKCRKSSECVNLFAEQKENGNKIEICSFNENNDEILVCCSEDDFNKSQHTRGALDYGSCELKYKSLRKKEPTIKLFVFNGDEVDPNEFSSVAAIGWLSWVDFSVSWRCAGNLITESYLLSAAHCMTYDGNYPNVIRLGDIDLSSSEDDQFVQQFGISKIIVHPDYDAALHANDIALVKVDGRVL